MRDLDDQFRSSDRTADLRDHDAAEDRHHTAAHPPGFASALQRRVMQRRAAAQAPASESDLENAVQNGAGGEQLPGEVRTKLEGSLGADFSEVRIHEGPEAARVGADAFTQGTDLHFAPGQYKPGTPEGDRLISHELAHVVQQREGRVPAPTRLGGAVNDDPALEAEADAVGARAAVGAPAAVAGGSGGAAAEAPMQAKLTIGKAGGPDPQRVVDIDEIEGVVTEVIALNDPGLMAAAKKVSADKPNSAIRDAVLVLYRNDRRFDSIAALAAATTERLQLIQDVAAVDWEAGDVKDIAEAHPEHGAFVKALTGLVDPGKIEALWLLTIQGVHFQKGLNAKDKKKDPNPHYIQLAEEFESLLAIQAGDKPALWSGGYDVSMYAQSQGYRTLEVTAAGKMFDQLKLFRDFSTLGPLWNNISKKFTSSFAGECHVFVRTMDKGSVLFRQELAEAAHLEGIKAMKWHVMKGSDLGTLSEVDGAGKPAPGFTFDGYRAAATAMTADAFRAPAGKDAIKDEPTTAEGVHDKMVEEQKQIPAYVTKLKEFVDGRAAWLKVDGPAYQPKLDHLKEKAELRLKNDPAMGVDLADLFAEIKDDLAKDIAHLSRDKKAEPE